MLKILNKIYIRVNKKIISIEKPALKTCYDRDFRKNLKTIEQEQVGSLIDHLSQEIENINGVKDKLNSTQSNIKGKQKKPGKALKGKFNQVKEHLLTSFNDMLKHITLLKTELENLLALRKNEVFQDGALTSRVKLHTKNRDEQSKLDCVYLRRVALKKYHSEYVVDKYAKEAADADHRTELDTQLGQLIKQGQKQYYDREVDNVSEQFKPLLINCQLPKLSLGKIEQESLGSGSVESPEKLRALANDYTSLSRVLNEVKSWRDLDWTSSPQGLLAEVKQFYEQQTGENKDEYWKSEGAVLMLAMTKQSCSEIEGSIKLVLDQLESFSKTLQDAQTKFDAKADEIEKEEKAAQIKAAKAEAAKAAATQKQNISPTQRNVDKIDDTEARKAQSEGDREAAKAEADKAAAKAKADKAAAKAKAKKSS